ncbi:histidinol-phosphate aminotransferase [Paenibacillus shirakamiensis]|uniref:Histidinol-phosphate aminotransferase n=1 Tax=Paenibacillus shirakamiensis TaxID=1265935 RepID=A0ABS4JCV8_9BACL|nr:histidinol-phosphate transaminase [Paenibacillus shirakamiensis]MBP1999552.1 histidinol-phosphate aminotransferase [Paenibacillus shirakamiensis]
MQPKPNIVNLPIYTPGKPLEEVKRELGLEEVIKLASNENPYGSSSNVRAAIDQELSQLNIYPDGSAAELTHVLAGHLGVNRDQIIFGCGSDEIIALIARAFLVPGDENIMADMTFSVYKSNADIEGAITHEVPLKDGVHDLDAMFDAINEKTKLMWICNPNNPTGTIVTSDELKAFLDKVPSHVLVVLDEAYVEYVTDSSFPDGLSLIQQYANLVILRTFSKIHGLASLRIGYGVGPAPIIKLINQVREPFNTSRFAQAAAKVAIQDHEFVAFCKQKNDEGREFLYGEFKRLDLHYFPAHGNFVFFDAKQSSIDVFQALLKRGIIVRGGFGKYPNYVRVSVGTEEHSRKFIQALEEVMEEQKSQVVAE